MLILHALLFSGLFSTPVVAAPGLELYSHKSEFPEPSPLLEPDIPREAYSRWYRLYGPGRPIIPAAFVDDVMLIDNPTTIKLFRLLDEPGRLHFEGTLQNHGLVRFVGHWIRYPTPGDSRESRGELVIAELIGGKFKITIGPVIPSEAHNPTQAHVNFDDRWYRLYNDRTSVDFFDDLMQIQGSNTDHRSITLYSLPDPAHEQPQPMHIDEIVTEHHFQLLIGPWKRYPTSRTPPEHRNQVAYVRRPRNGQFSIILFGSL